VATDPGSVLEVLRSIFNSFSMRSNFIVLLVILPGFLLSQSDSLRDYWWQIGYASNPDFLEFGGTDFNFHENPVALSYNYRSLNIQETNASICDENGDLLFYTNGLAICNRFGDTITNGAGLNPGVFADINGMWGYSAGNGAFVLPDPGNENQYYLIHETYDNYPEGGTVTSFYLYYTHVDMSSPEGLVLSKNNLILADTFDVGHTTAVRHANGRDWWIVKARFDTNDFHTFLLGPDGIHYSHLQEVGAPIDRSAGLSQAVFSPDGTMYARNDRSHIPGPQYFKLYDFDRCTGGLSNMRNVVLQDSSWGSGIAFSPNSRYLYVSNTPVVYQFDTEAPDLEASKVVIAEWDLEYAPYPFPANYFMMQLAPDNKIYVCSKGSTYAMHVIHDPDQPGLACNFEKMALMLPTYNNSSIPHFPYYKLGPLEGSPCDTLSVAVNDLEASRSFFQVFPNPTTGHVTIQTNSIYSKEGEFFLYNAAGILIAQIPFQNSTNSMDLSLDHLPNGVYLLQLNVGGSVNHAVKIVLLK
jgi:hypothetical protein